MQIDKVQLGSAVTSAAVGHVVAVSNDIYDETNELYQSAINSEVKLRTDDREYNVENPNGAGFVILSSDKTFQEQVTKTNTIYEIRYDYDLENTRYTLPNNITLKFVGGSINNGYLVGSNTVIDAMPIRIMEGIVLEGTWRADIAEAIWFAKADCVLSTDGKMTYISGTDNHYNFENLLKFQNINITKGCYYNTAPLQLSTGQTVNGCGSIIKTNKSVCFRVWGESDTPTTNVSISNITLYGSYNEYTSSMGIREWDHGIELDGNVSNVTITNCTCSYFNGDGINLGEMDNGSVENPKIWGVSNVEISNCIIEWNGRQGISLMGGENVSIRGCKISNIKAQTSGGSAPDGPWAGIDVEPNKVWVGDRTHKGETGYGQYMMVVCNNITIEDCDISNTQGTSFQLTSHLLDGTQRGSFPNRSITFSKCSTDKAIHLWACEKVTLKDVCIKLKAAGNGIVFQNAEQNDIILDNIEIHGIVQTDPSGNGIYFVETNRKKRNISLKDIIVRGAFNYGIQSWITNTDGGVDGISFNNILITNCLNQCMFTGHIKNVTYMGFKTADKGVNIDGTAMVSSSGWDIPDAKLDDIATRKDFDANIQSSICSTEATPSTSTLGHIIYDTDKKALKSYNGSTWDIYSKNTGVSQHYDNVRILYHDSLNADDLNLPKFATLEEWPSLESLGQMPTGIYLTSGDRSLIIAPEFEDSYVWGKQQEYNSSASINTLTTAISTYNGETLTQYLYDNYLNDPDAILCNDAHEYFRTNANGKGIQSGYWFIPSIAEMMFISRNMNAVKAAFSVLLGGQEMDNGYFWTVNEYGGSAYVMRFNSDWSDGNIYCVGKPIECKCMFISSLSHIDNNKLRW